MDDIKRNRNLIATVAAAVIVLGIVLACSLPRTSSLPPAQPPAADSAAAQSVESDGYLLRDYADFGSGSAADLPSMDWLGLVAGMGIKLGFVVALVYLAVWALRRYVYRDPAVTPERRPVSLVGSLNLTPSRTVYVLEVGGKMIVVGATASQMGLLTEITDPEAVENMRSMSGDSPVGGQFSALLGAARRQFESRAAAASDEASHKAPVLTPVEAPAGASADASAPGSVNAPVEGFGEPAPPDSTPAELHTVGPLRPERPQPARPRRAASPLQAGPQMEVAPPGEAATPATDVSQIGTTSRNGDASQTKTASQIKEEARLFMEERLATIRQAMEK